METVTIPWHIVGPVATMIGAIVGVGVGWGAMKGIVASLKSEVADFKVMASEMRGEVIALKTNGLHDAKAIDSLTERVNALETDVSALKAKQPNRKR